MKGKLFFALFFLILFTGFPLDAFAQVPGIDGPIVPCGTNSTGPCSLCHVWVLIHNIVQFLLFIVIPLGVIGIAWAGVLLFTSRGDPGQVTKGKQILWYTVIGIVIALAAWIIINTILVTLLKGTDGFSATDLWEFPADCDTVTRAETGVCANDTDTPKQRCTENADCAAGEGPCAEYVCSGNTTQECTPAQSCTADDDCPSSISCVDSFCGGDPCAGAGSCVRAGSAFNPLEGRALVRVCGNGRIDNDGVCSLNQDKQCITNSDCGAGEGECVSVREQCDPSASPAFPGGATCVDHGFDGGELLCTGCKLSFSLCKEPPPPETPIRTCSDCVTRFGLFGCTAARCQVGYCSNDDAQPCSTNAECGVGSCVTTVTSNVGFCQGNREIDCKEDAACPSGASGACVKEAQCEFTPLGTNDNGQTYGNCENPFLGRSVDVPRIDRIVDCTAPFYTDGGVEPLLIHDKPPTCTIIGANFHPRENEIFGTKKLAGTVKSTDGNTKIRFTWSPDMLEDPFYVENFIERHGTREVELPIRVKNGVGAEGNFSNTEFLRIQAAVPYNIRVVRPSNTHVTLEWSTNLAVDGALWLDTDGDKSVLDAPAGAQCFNTYPDNAEGTTCGADPESKEFDHILTLKELSTNTRYLVSLAYQQRSGVGVPLYRQRQFEFATLSQSTDTIPPLVTIEKPLEGDTMSGQFQLEANITDNVGSEAINTVKFEVIRDGSVVFSDLTPIRVGDTDLYRSRIFNTEAEDDEKYIVRVTATDTNNNQGRADHEFHIKNTDTENPPEITWLQPADGITVLGNFDIEVSVRDTGGTQAGISQMDIGIDGANVNSSCTGPFSGISGNAAGTFSCTIDSTTLGGDGQKTITVIARDLDNNETSSLRTVNVQNEDTETPTVSFLNIGNDQQINNIPYFVEVTASDNVGVQRVELLVDGVLEDTKTSASPCTSCAFTLTFDEPDGLNYSLAMKAYDSNPSAPGAATISGIDVDTTAPTFGTVTLTPSTGPYSGSINVTVDVTDNVSGVAQVEFILGSETVVRTNPDSGNTYSADIDISSLSDGTYELKLNAIDEFRNSTGDVTQANVEVDNP